MDFKPTLQAAIQVMEKLLRSPQIALTTDWSTQIRSCLVWAMDLNRFGATQADMGELRQGLLNVCRSIRGSGELSREPVNSHREDVVTIVYSVANSLPKLREGTDAIA